MSKDQMADATDDHIIKLFEELTDDTEWDHPKRQWDLFRGGSVQASREFAAFAEKKPQRASKIVLSFAPERQERPAGMGIEGLSKSNYPIEKLFEIIRELERKGFSTGEFRRGVARSLQKISHKNNGLPNDILNLLKDWYMQEPHPDINEAENNGAREEPQNESILWGYGGVYSLPGGRDIYFETIASGYLLRKPPEHEYFAKFIETIIPFEKHPKIWQITFRSMNFLFNWDKKKATEFFDFIIRNVPEVIENRNGIIGYAEIFNLIPEKTIIQNWIKLVGSKDSDFRKQAFGELLFLYILIYPDDSWGMSELSLVINNETKYFKEQRGVAFAAAKHWHDIKHQKICTDTITSLSLTCDKTTQDAISTIFEYGQDIALTLNMKKIITAILPNDGILIQSAERLVEGVLNYTSIEPQIISDICHRIIEVGKDEIKNYGSRFSMVAEPLVSISLTLHRMQPPYRSQGLNLFENFIESNIPHARQALNILDRKPTNT